MIGSELIAQIIMVQVGVLVLATVFAFAHGAWREWIRHEDPPRLARARVALAAAIGVDGAVPLGDGLARLPRRLRRRVLIDLAGSLRGAQRERLSQIALALRVIDRGRRWARGAFWWRRLKGAHLLALLLPDDPLLVRLYDDRHPAVRAEAITSAADRVGGPDGKIADRIVSMLADPSPLCRHAAADTLLRAGPTVAPTVAAHLNRRQDGSLPALLDIAAARPDPRYEAGALTLVREGTPPVRAAAARLLGALGGDSATEALIVLLGHPEPAVREAAAAGLGHLGHWPAASAVAMLLRDRAWDVRRAAGEALVALGAPGRLMLQRYAHDRDPFAADMAQRVTRTSQLRAVTTSGGR